MDILFLEHHGAYPRFKFTQAYQVVSLEDPYHPRDIGFAMSYNKAYEIAEEYRSECDTEMYGGMGIKIYEILIQE
jgi:hypothetical protein